MPWTSYARQPDGRVKFVDDAGGELTLLDSPSVAEQMAQIDAAAPPAPAPAPLAPMTPEVVPDGIVAAKSPTMVADYAQVPGMFMPPKPPPIPGTPLAAPAQPPAPAPAPAAAPPAVPAAPAPIVRTGGTTSASDKLKEAQARLLEQQALDELKGSPGTFVPGGTFPTGRAEQFAAGPDPMETLAREEAEKKLGRAQSDLVYVEARKNQELQETNAAEAQRAADRQKALQELQARQQEKLGGVLKQIDGKRQEIADAKLDPDRLLKDMSGAQQALTAIMLGLGGFGKALAGEDGPSGAMQQIDQALKTDLEMQRWAVEQKRGDLNSLGEIYRLTKEQFGDEKMAQDAAYLAGLDIYKAKIAKTMAEADAAMGVETQYDENGQIVAGAPYSMRAAELNAKLDVEQARTREQLSQAANGQVTQQYQTVQDKVVGGKAPNKAKAAELLGKAAEALGDGKAQQVTYEEVKGDGSKEKVRYTLPSWIEEGEGKVLRKELGDIQSLKADIANLEKQLRDHPIGSKTFDKSKTDGLMERVSSKANVVLGQGAKNNDEAARWAAILGSVTTGGVDAVKDLDRWADNMARNKLDQVNAKAVGDRPAVAVPQEVQDIAAGKMPKGSSGGGGIVRPSQAGKPSAPVVRATGVRATPLDRAGASLVTATTAKNDKTRAAATKAARLALDDSLRANQLGPQEYAVAVQMADAGDVDGLLAFLGRMRGTVSLGPGRSLDDYNRSVSNQIMLQELRRAGEAPRQALSSGPSATTVSISTSTKKRGKLRGRSRPRPCATQHGHGLRSGRPTRRGACFRGGGAAPLRRVRPAGERRRPDAEGRRELGAGQRRRGRAPGAVLHGEDRLPAGRRRLPAAGGI